MTAHAGLGLKVEHLADALAATDEGLWFEVHAENHLVDGGPRRAWLEAARARRPVSLHGVGASLGAHADPDPTHLARLAALVRRIEPVRVSEHLAWCGLPGLALPDLLPVRRTRASLARLAANVGRLQDAIGRAVSIENPSHYLRVPGHELDEVGFLVALARRSGCRLLVDIANVHVGANNLGFDAGAWLDAVPGDLVDEIHVAGPTPDPRLGATLLVDTHAAPVPDAVWTLLERLLARIGPRPVLVERDAALPPFAGLLAERTRAEHVLRTAAAAFGALPVAESA